MKYTLEHLEYKTKISKDALLYGDFDAKEMLLQKIAEKNEHGGIIFTIQLPLDSSDMYEYRIYCHPKEDYNGDDFIKDDPSILVSFDNPTLYSTK